MRKSRPDVVQIGMSTLLCITICALIVTAGCSEDENEVPVAPDWDDPIPMVLIPAGSFRMGDITNQGDMREKPVHEVTITRPFLMSLTEVTQAQYKEQRLLTSRSGTGPGEMVLWEWELQIPTGRSQGTQQFWSL